VRHHKTEKKPVEKWRKSVEKVEKDGMSISMAVGIRAAIQLSHNCQPGFCQRPRMLKVPPLICQQCWIFAGTLEFY